MRSADEVRAKNVAAMGNDFGEVFTVLSNELTFLSWQFQELSELYGGPLRLEVMNRAAPFFFWLLQRTWWDEVLLGITRLLAPKQSMGKANLTFQQLPELIGNQTLRAKVEKQVGDVVALGAFATAWRNKRIAHRDLGVAGGKGCGARLREWSRLPHPQVRLERPMLCPTELRAPVTD
jgi:HEPN superfamily AbiU2-like protein